MRSEKALTELLKFACPSIQYRVRRDILNQSISSKTLRSLQPQILQDSLVREVLGWQRPDGWLGWDFHGAKGLEAGIRILAEKGLEPQHPGLAKALSALEKRADRLARGLGKAGTILDEQRLGGALMIRAVVYAYTGYEDKPYVQEQVQAALNGFKAVLAVKDIKDIAENYRGKLVFRPAQQWPSIYHLRLLAFTHLWRSRENRQMITGAIQRLVDLSPLPNINVHYKSQIIAPASFTMRDFNPDLSAMNDADWMMWFHRTECLARLGVIHSIPKLHKQTATLDKMLDEGWFTKRLAHSYFTHWGAYTGLMLEPDWRSRQRRIYDLTFRSLLIQHYTDEATN